MRLWSVHTALVGEVVGMYLELKEQDGGPILIGEHLYRDRNMVEGRGFEYSQGHISMEQGLRIGNRSLFSGYFCIGQEHGCVSGDQSLSSRNKAAHLKSITHQVLPYPTETWLRVGGFHHSLGLVQEYKCSQASRYLSVPLQKKTWRWSEF